MKESSKLLKAIVGICKGLGFLRTYTQQTGHGFHYFVTNLKWLKTGVL